MSDTTQILQLPGAQLESIEQDGDSVTLHFSLVHLVQETWPSAASRLKATCRTARAS